MANSYPVFFFALNFRVFITFTAMTDMHPTEIRSYNMSRIKGKILSNKFRIFMVN
jgi:hypothetical protein